MTELLVSRGDAQSDALVMTFACRFATLWFTVLLGWAATVVLHFSLRPGSLSADVPITVFTREEAE